MNTCAHCGEPLPTSGRGRRKLYCSPACRLKAFRCKPAAAVMNPFRASSAKMMPASHSPNSVFRFERVAPALVRVHHGETFAGLLINKGWVDGTERWVALRGAEFIVAGTLADAKAAAIELARNGIKHG